MSVDPGLPMSVEPRATYVSGAQGYLCQWSPGLPMSVEPRATSVNAPPYFEKYSTCIH